MREILSQIPSMTKEQCEQVITLCQQRLSQLESSKLDAVESEVLLALLDLLRTKHYPDVPTGDVRHIKWQRGLKIKDFKTSVKHLRRFEKFHLNDIPNRSLQRWRKIYMSCVHRYCQNTLSISGNPPIANLIAFLGCPELVIDHAFPGYAQAGLLHALFK